MRFSSAGVWGVLVLLLAVSQGTVGLASPSRQPLEIQSRTLEIDHENRRATFSGEVNARLNGMVIFCGELIVEYDGQSNIRSLSANRGVRFQRDGIVARSRQARLDMHKGILMLTGDPFLERDGHRISGERVEISLRTGRVDITQASGTFYLPSGHSP